MVKSNQQTWNSITSLIDGFMNYPIDVKTNMNNGTTLSVTEENIAVMLGDVFSYYSAKHLFSLITAMDVFGTSQQQNVSEALTCIIG